MEYTTKSSILTQQVLNQATGELETQILREEKTIKRVRGGFNMIYHKSYEQIMEAVIRSNKDLKLFNWITNQFTYARVEVPVVYSECTIDVSQPVFSKLVKQLVELNYLLRVGRGIYRLNPFIYVPYKGDSSILQDEWNQLVKGTNNEC